MATAMPLRRALALAGLGVMVVLAYNARALHCGDCSPRDFFTPCPISLTLLSLITLAAATLVVLRQRRLRRESARRCGCGEGVEKNWRYCPGCGAQRF